MAKHRRRGSVYLLVLLVMISSLSLVTGLQHVLLRRIQNLEQTQIDRRIRNAMLLGLQQGIRLLAEDEDPAVDGPDEPWAQRLEFTSTEGVRLALQLEDAQSLFNLNHLSLPVTPSTPRTWMEIFSDLLQNAGQNTDPEVFAFLQQQLDESEFWFESPEQLYLMLPESQDLQSVSYLIAAVPRPGTRPLPMNINSVHPVVLRAVVGDSMQGWVDGVLAARSEESIRNLDTVLRPLPDALRSVLARVLDVRCEYVNVNITARLEQSEQSLSALLKRNGSEVEVIRCQW